MGFGDSSMVDFGNAGSPVTGVSGMDGRGSCVSIADTAGSLLFYAFTRATIPGNSGLIYNKQHQLMVNGNNILGQGWYNEMVVLPSRIIQINIIYFQLVLHSVVIMDYSAVSLICL
ncbi:MAG: hypothetical protein IPL74_01545 [Bacteroidetes bacterium]|nr:hypothetical protein [Bacteroidota bacterium]